jgi:hypothetical protein
MTAPDLTPAPLPPDHLTQIRDDLASVPAPPWCWIGSRGAGGPELVTDHSGRQYLLRAVKPTDQHGEELLDPVDDSPVYGDLAFRDQRDGEKYSTMRSGNRLATGRTDYDPDNIVGVDNPIARWIERSAAHAQALLAEVDRLTALVEFEKEDAASLRTKVGDRNATIDRLSTRVGELEALAKSRAEAVLAGKLLFNHVQQVLGGWAKCDGCEAANDQCDGKLACDEARAWDRLVDAAWRSS